jgi:hypothetical protein
LDRVAPHSLQLLLIAQPVLINPILYKEHAMRVLVGISVPLELVMI